MKAEELKKIEIELRIIIPENLKSIWENYPLKGAVGNSEHCIWDNAKSIISENKRLREKHNWPSDLFFIGDDGAGNQFAINLNDPDVPIGIEFEDSSRRFNPLNGLGLKRESLAGWFTSVIKEMVNDGYNLETGETEGGLWSSLLIIVVGVAVIVLIFSSVIGIHMLFDYFFN